jgi:hypothetical protein
MGLFISPFILLYCLGALSFNNEMLLNRLSPIKRMADVRTKLENIPNCASDLATAKAICKKLNIDGEIDFISKRENHISFPVYEPGLKTMVFVNTENDSVVITRDQLGPFRAMSYLHQMPGPHNESIRANSPFLKVWRIITNLVAFVLLFLALSGAYLWFHLKAEGKLGLFVIILGILSLIFLAILIF